MNLLMLEKTALALFATPPFLRVVRAVGAEPDGQTRRLLIKAFKQEIAKQLAKALEEADKRHEDA